MAAATETEASPPTDASWESGGGGNDELKQALPELESSPQDGGGGGGQSIAEPGGGAGPQETAASSAAPGLGHEQPQDSCEAGAAALPKGPEEPERPVKRSFQIPRKSREKKGGASPPPQPLSLSPSIFPLEPLCLFFPHPPETRKHACSAGRPRLRVVREEGGGSTRPCSPSPRGSWKQLGFEA